MGGGHRDSPMRQSVWDIYWRQRQSWTLAQGAKVESGDGGCKAIGEGDGRRREIGKGNHEVEGEGAMKGGSTVMWLLVLAMVVRKSMVWLRESANDDLKEFWVNMGEKLGFEGVEGRVLGYRVGA
ncbi:hypothetical protein GOBAR_DD13783 [Gossypium barbadense]|nr:hypothetical protein GOBAR_DD13783 [Gossypium barbadense]